MMMVVRVGNKRMVGVGNAVMVRVVTNTQLGSQKVTGKWESVQSIGKSGG